MTAEMSQRLIRYERAMPRALRQVGRLAGRCLDNPRLFDLQQRLSAGTYHGPKNAFTGWLAGRRSVLDIGCGTGALAASLFSFDAVAYTGVEIDRRYVEYARRRYPRAQFMCVDATRLELPTSSLFDAVLVFSILHHLTDAEAERMVRHISGVLAPGGVVLAAEPLFPILDQYRGAAWFRALASSALLKADRGDYIRDRESYLDLWRGFRVAEERHFRISCHDFCGFALTAMP